MGIGISLAERGFVPDFTVRSAIRSLLKQRLAEMPGPENADENFAKELAKASIAEFTKEANEQHYEVPAEFFKICLGKRLKYSSCFYESGATTLDEAEVAMLELYGERAELKDGQAILDLGCGWGSFSLWAAERYPQSQITGVSNSNSQREFIMARAKERGLTNINILTADMNDFQIDQKFDRIVSIEMFEHMRNYRELFAKVASWLAADGKVFIHVFSHKTNPYFFETEGDDNWMGRYFFTGGIMPSRKLYHQYRDVLEIEQSWDVNGINYGQTSLHWLENLDRRKDEAMSVLAGTYGAAQAKIWFNRWRIFYLSCAELFNYDRGEEWGVSHFRFVHPKSTD